MQTIAISKVKMNKDNPRVFKANKEQKLINSLLTFPEMLTLRPLVIDDNNVILGGNFRKKALDYIYSLSSIELNSKLSMLISDVERLNELKGIWSSRVDKKLVEVVYAKDLSDEQKREFIVKDNVSFGEWDFDILANEWDADLLNDWGMEVPEFEVDLDKYFEATDEIADIENKNKIVLEYNEVDYNKVKDALLRISKSYEDAVYKLLGL